METSAASDSELLAAWVAHRRESAFHALVARYATLVHMAAKRTCGDDSLAADASQLVFILLAQKAKSLTTHPTLAGWLHVTAVLKTRDLLDKARRESRKRQHLSAAMETNPSNPSGDVWQEMQPVLDDALAALSARDREALLLRFYRSLSIREIAATLGIATDAAQKRIDRATERLRGKLARRGVQTGGSLSAAMLAGFAADAQATVPSASLIASKAVAASGALTFKSTLTTLFAVKTASFVPPIIALILVGTWIGSQRQSIRALDRQSDLLESAISGRSASSTTLSAAPSPASHQASSAQEKGKPSMDWVQIADKMAKTGFNDLDQMMFDQRMGKMSKEELLAAMDEIAVLDLPQNIRQRLQEMVIFPFSMKFSEFAVTSLADRELGGFCIHHLTCAMERWAQKDFEKASGWMDGQISAGTFATKALDGKNWTQIGYESVLIRTLLTRGEDHLLQRFNRLPPDMRKDVIMGAATAWRAYGVFEPAEEEAFRDLVRKELPVADQMEVFAARAREVWAGGAPAVDKFLETIQATPDERLRCVGKAAGFWVANIANESNVTREDIIRLRDWVGKHVPQAVDRFTGESLGYAAENKGLAPSMVRKMTYSEAAAFAVEFNEASGNDDVLAAFLKSEGAKSDKTQSRVLAGKISDDSLRAEILKNLE